MQATGNGCLSFFLMSRYRVLPCRNKLISSHLGPRAYMHLKLGETQALTVNQMLRLTLNRDFSG